MVKRRMTVGGLLRLLGDMGEVLLPAGSRLEAWRKMRGLGPVFDLEGYFPSVVTLVANRLERRGLVETIGTGDGLVVRITDRGKKEMLKFRLSEFTPKRGKWDGLWRLVFFDVPDEKKHKRDELRRFLKILGMKQMQESVFVSPYDVSSEVKYLREVLDVPHGVKLGVLRWIENEEELKEIFGV